jgi:Mat/Ecp fimbriae major subunit
MKNFVKFTAAASLAVALGLGATSAQAATANANASATILAPVTVTKTSDLQFGTIAVGTSGGNVAIDSVGARVCGAGLVCTATTTAANFTVTGVVGQTVGISIPGSVTLTSGTNNMTASLAGTPATLVLAATNTFAVGGTLAVGATQAAGNYSGTFTVTVNYQ